MQNEYKNLDNNALSWCSGIYWEELASKQIGPAMPGKNNTDITSLTAVSYDGKSSSFTTIVGFLVSNVATLWSTSILLSHHFPKTLHMSNDFDLP